MHISKRNLMNRFVVDFVAYDKAGKPILFGLTTSVGASPEAIRYLLACLDGSKTKIPFGILADVDQILLYHKDGDGPAKLVWSSPSAEILRHYDPEYGSRRVFADFLKGLIEAWLRDLAYHWKSSVPPAQEQMAAIGLLDRLEGGTTKSEVRLAGTPVS